MKPGRAASGKTAVMGLLKRHTAKQPSQIRTTVIKTLKPRELQGVVRKHVEFGATVNTDALFSYRGLGYDYVHNVIDHAEKYVEGTVHTNGVENFWSLLKRSIRGTYVSIEPFHLFRYLDEQTFRFNNRKMSDSDRFSITAGSVFGKQLTFAQLTAADPPC